LKSKAPYSKTELDKALAAIKGKVKGVSFTAQAQGEKWIVTPSGGGKKKAAGSVELAMKKEGTISEEAQKGIDALDQVTAGYASKGATQEEMTAAVKSVRRKFKFKSIEVEQKDGFWYFDYEINPKGKKKGPKSKSVDDIFKDTELRKKIKLEIDKFKPEVSDWVAVFPAKGIQLNIKKKDKYEKATLLNVLGSSKIQQMQIALTGSLDTTLLRDNSATEDKREAKGGSFTMQGSSVQAFNEISRISSAIIKDLRNTELFFISGTDVPRKLKGARSSELIKLNPENTITDALYRSVAQKYSGSMQAKFSGQVHHIIPLYLGGSHVIQNLIKIQGQKASDISDSAHAALHNFIDTTEVELFIKQKIGGEDEVSIRTTLKDIDIAEKLKDHLKVSIGTLRNNGAIAYKETSINLK
jgi:hypothetical protein